jgi:exodeoxyribonuclease VII large subunit
MSRDRELADRLGAQLDALSPLRVLERGYAVPRDPAGRVLRRRADFPPGQPFRLRVSDGDVAARAE